MTRRAEALQAASSRGAGREAAVESSEAAVESSEAAVESSEAAERIVRRNRRPFSRGDMLALRVGAALVIVILLWFVWEMTATVRADRAVGPGSLPPAGMHGG